MLFQFCDNFVNYVNLILITFCFLFLCTDSKQMNAVKEALHVSTVPSAVVCREEEQNRVMNFCKACIEHGKSRSLYVCGCPGTGKSLSIEKVRQALVDWAVQVRLYSFLFP